MLIKEASWISLKQAASTVVPVVRKQFLCEKPVRSAALEVNYAYGSVEDWVFGVP